MLTPSRERIERALRLFAEGRPGQPDSFETIFERLGAEIYVRQAVLSRLPSPPSDLPAQQELARLFSYAALRLTDLLTRRGLVEFVRSRLALLSGEESAAWYSFGALCVKDFHIDVGSLMDSVAPVVLQACGLVEMKGEVRFPGFSDIQGDGGPRSGAFRSRLPAAVRTALDSTAEWWPDVKAIRDVLVHREHQKIAFGGPAEGVLFQVYTPDLSPKVVHPAFLWRSGNNVADFRRYSAYVVAGVLVLLEDLGAALTEHLGLSKESLNGSFRAGDFADLIGALREMLG